MAYVVEKADGTEVERNDFKSAKAIFDKEGIRLWKRKYTNKRYVEYLDEILEAKPGHDEQLPVV